MDMSSLQSLRKKLGTFRREEDGGVLIFVGLGFFAMMGLAALAVDMSSAYALRTDLQNTADSAALAAVQELPNQGLAIATALDYAQKNMPLADHGVTVNGSDVVTGNWDPDTRTLAAGGAPVNAIQVTARRSQANGNPAPTFFSRVFGKEGINITASAIVVQGANFPCMTALDPNIQNALKVGDQGSIIANDCRMQVNSDDVCALYSETGGTIEAAEVNVVGGNCFAGSSSPEPEENMPYVPDPLAGLPTPEIGPCGGNTNVSHNSGSHTLSPGTYCGGLSFNGDADITFEPGVYVIKDKDFSISGSVTVQGEGVMFYLNDDTALQWSGGDSVDLSAPTTGDYAGMLVYADPAPSKSTKHNVTSDTTLSYEGAVYLPDGELEITGDATTTTTTGGWSSFSARTIKTTGTGNIIINSDYASSDVPLPNGLNIANRLVR
jgi:Flp pilus assembly protein TadG